MWYQQPPMPPFGQIWKLCANAVPDFGAVIGSAGWNRRRDDKFQHFLDRNQARPALDAGTQVPLRHLDVSIAIVIKLQLVI
jgi:hypothetical protein